MHFLRIVISDTHLGKKVSAAEYLLEFLTCVHRGEISTNEIILNGDIIDGWKLASKKRKPLFELHARVLDALWAIEAQGVKISYILGNHDEDLRKQKWTNRPFTLSAQGTLPPVALHFRKAVKFEDPQGRKTLVLHGDQFDKVFSQKETGKMLSHIGDRAYDASVSLNRAFLKLARTLRHDAHFSLSAYIKKRTKSALGIIERFEQAVTADALSQRFQVVVCGHIHHAEIRNFVSDKGRKVQYVNSGDWVESCACVAQTADGEWQILPWFEERLKRKLDRLPTQDDPNPFAAYRPYTIEFLERLRTIWPGRDAQNLTQEYRRVTRKIEKDEMSDRKRTDLLHRRAALEAQLKVA